MTPSFYKKLIWLAMSCLCIAPLAANAAKSNPLAAPAGPQIIWQKWSPEAFSQAKRENKMLLVSVGIEVCFACRWMEEFTYQDPRVVRLIMDHFVPIQVDADNQPDLGERYSDWAWPATVFMAPDTTQVLALRGNRRPPDFIPLLNKLITQHAQGKLEPDTLAPYAAPAAPALSDLTDLRDKLRSTLDDDFDDKLSGFNDEYKEIENSGNFVQLLMRAHAERDRKSEQRFLNTAYKMLGRIDPVWGGFFAAGLDGWTKPIPEKRTGAQATALYVYATAYSLTKDKRFLDAAKEVDRYLRIWMQAPDGTFYTSQKDLAPNLPSDWTPQRYFALDTDSKRRRYGIPPIDHAVYTDLNARVIVAYAKLYEASGEESFLRTAEKCARVIIQQRQQTAGWVLHTIDTEAIKQDQRIHLKAALPTPYLRSQAHFGLALMALQRVTGDTFWLHSAQRLADALRLKLEDQKLGGFYASLPNALDGMFARRKPLQDNGVAARFLYQLGKYSKNEDLIRSAERAVRVVSVPNILAREGRIIGELAVALEMLTMDYVEFTVVGDATDPKAQNLFKAARAYYEPRKLLHYEKPGRYPNLGRATLYICSQDACSTPIFDTKDIAPQAAKFQKPRESSKRVAEAL